ncbi:MAG: xanthine dehydrogenase family protein subunit M [Candidatus Hydrogenedentota bacterium]
MKRFNVIVPLTLKELLKLKSRYKDKARIIAGGTDNLVRWKDNIGVPDTAISIMKIKELKAINKKGNTISIGATCTFTDIIESKIVNKYGSVLVQACREIGAVQIRNVGTIGGNIANASPAGDTIPPLMVLNAKIKVISLKRSREIPITEFFTGPGKTVLKSDEIIEGIYFQKMEKDDKSFFLKIGPRRAQAISKVSSCGIVRLDRNKRVKKVWLALGAVAPTVIRLNKLEDYLQNKVITDAILQQTQKQASLLSIPISDIRSTAEYRKHIAGVLIRRGLEMIGKA